MVDDPNGEHAKQDAFHDHPRQSRDLLAEIALWAGDCLSRDRVLPGLDDCVGEMAFCCGRV